MTAPQSCFRTRMFHKGTRVVACEKYEGVIDGFTDDGKYIVKFDIPVRFPTLGIRVERSAFEYGSVKELHINVP